MDDVSSANVFRPNHPVPDAHSSTVHVGDLRLEPETRKLSKRSKPVFLSPKEFDLLAYLMKNRGVILTYGNILSTIWGPEYGSEVEYLRTYIRLLREKIEDNPARSEYVLHEAGVGYWFCERFGAERQRKPWEVQ